MKYLSGIIFLIFVSSFSFAQKTNYYSEKFGKLIIALPSKPDSFNLGSDKMLMSKTAKGVLNVSNVDVSHRLDPLPSKAELKNFYVEEIDWIYSQSVKPDEIEFFKIGTYDAAYFPVTDPDIGIGYCIVVLIGKEYYMALYTIPDFDKKELEYTKKEFIELFTFNNSVVKNGK